MKVAMILAAGRGERMRPLTDFVPKPLLQIKNKALIEYHLEKLHRAGYDSVVINHAWLGDKLVDYLGDGKRYSIPIYYSAENPALETAGGIIKALPLLSQLMGAQQCFTVINGDTFSDMDFNLLPQDLGDDLGHLVMVNNPPHNPSGDFYYYDKRLYTAKGQKLTFSGIAVYHRSLFLDMQAEKLPLAPMLRQQIENQRLSAYHHHNGYWFDVGTPARLNELNQMEGI